MGPFDFGDDTYNPNDDSTVAYREAMAHVIADLKAPYLNKPDNDFITHVTPLQQGEIDACRVEQRLGTDADLIDLCTRIVAIREDETKLMQRWLAAHNHSTRRKLPPPNINWILRKAQGQ
ncbi:MAG TPA: hypothetical protein VMB71_09615 [Acetobacteraceae bacterium]|nr:hypothetical protein [Acetobacteraceae bacterium]